MTIDILDQTDTLNNTQIELLADILTYAIHQEKFASEIEVSVTIVTNDEIKKLNEQYRHIDEATDVLSFEMDDPFKPIDEDNVERVITIGDIIISMDKIKEQAKEYNHSFERELAFLTVHGFLHLIGYTHDTKEEEKAMFQKQESILEEFRLGR